MNDNSAVATKQDVQMLLDAMNSMGKNLEEQIAEKIEESERHTRILIEDLEERVLGSNTDRLSVHDDKLKNHEERIVDLESKPAFA